MSFVDAKPDLTGTRFSEDDLRYAQGYLHHLIERHEPEWLSNPAGYVGGLWRSASQYSACRLIHLAQVLFRAEKILDKDSIPFLIRKFREILRSHDERSYIEAITELEILWFFHGKVESARLEPRVPAYQIDAPDRPPGPDLEVRVRGVQVDVEVTVIYFRELDRWEEAVEELKNRFQKALMKKRVNRHVDFDFPLGFHGKRVSRKEFRSLVNAIVSEPEGKIDLQSYKLPGRIRWNRLSISGNQIRVGKIVFGGPGMEIDTAVSIGMNLVYFEEQERTRAEEALIRSVRATLDRKKDQLGGRSNILILRLGNHRVEYKGFLDMISQRIWPNRQYACYSSVALYKPPGTSKGRDERGHLTICSNPRALLPLSDEIMSQITSTN